MTWNLDLFRSEVRFAILGSGSRGNAAVVWTGDTAVLVDCGLSVRRVLRDLRTLGVEPGWVRGILVTHEHGDHVGGAEAVARDGLLRHVREARRPRERTRPAHAREVRQQHDDPVEERAPPRQTKKENVTGADRGGGARRVV